MSRYVSAAVAAAVGREYLDSFAAAMAKALTEHMAGIPQAEREHVYREVVYAVYDWHSALWMSEGGRFEQRLRELSEAQ